MKVRLDFSSGTLKLENMAQKPVIVEIPPPHILPNQLNDGEFGIIMKWNHSDCYVGLVVLYIPENDTLVSVSGCYWCECTRYFDDVNLFQVRKLAPGTKVSFVVEK